MRPVICLLLALLLGGSLYPSPASAADSPSEAKPITVVSYNVENYLRMDRYNPSIKKRETDAPKPESEIVAIIRIIKGINPDILGVIEMGGPDQFEDFCKRLKEAGVDLPHTEFVQAGDAARHLVLLSRFPIVARNSQTDLKFELNGVQEPFQRGILDVTIQVTPDYQLRVLTAHLKSQRPVPQGEALLRRHEAILLRNHVESILEAKPDTNLLLMGDLNDTAAQPPIREIEGPRGSKMHLTDLPLADSLGDRWTHFWEKEDIYSRLDYMMVNSALLPEVDLTKSRIERPEGWKDGSDHRPIVAIIHPEER